MLYQNRETLIEVYTLVFHLHVEDILVSNAFSATRDVQEVKFVNHASSVIILRIQGLFFRVFSVVIIELM